MQSLGVREAKEHFSEVIRRVAEEGEIYTVTSHGKAVARIVPIEPPLIATETMATWFRGLAELQAELGASIPERIDAVALVREGRGDRE